MKNRTSRLALALAALAGGVFSVAAYGQSEAGGTPAVITYQGEAQNSSGQALQGAGQVRFELYDLQSAGTLKGTAGPYAVTFTNGRFTADSVAFTATPPATDAYGTGAEQRWLQISVQAPGTTSFVTLTPRQRLTQTPFAKVASKALNVDAAGLTGTLAASFVSGNNLTQTNTAQTITGAKTFNNAGNVFVGNGSGLTNVAAASYSGPIGDGQLSSNVALLNRANQVFSQTNSFMGRLGVGTTTPSEAFEFVGGSGSFIRFTGSNGDFHYNGGSDGVMVFGNLGATTGRTTFTNAAGTQMLSILNSTGAVGINTNTPGAWSSPNGNIDLLEIAAPDVGMRIRNVNDPVGGMIWNSFGTLHLGLYNPTTTAFNQVPANSRRAFFSMSSDGRVGSTTNTGGSPNFRNLLDDGNGNMVVKANGSLSFANVLPNTEVVNHSNYLALFENTSSSNGDGIAIKIDQTHTNRNNHFVGFFNGSGLLTGRIEGFDLENGDWVPPPIPFPANPLYTISLNIQNRPTSQWFSPGTLPSSSLSGGTLPSAGLSGCPACSLSFNSGAFPSLNFNPGTLPSITNTPIQSISGAITVFPPSANSLQQLICWGTSNNLMDVLNAGLQDGTWAATYIAAKQICMDEGVTYGSKGADYAEYIERADHTDHIRWGEVVGVKGGKVSRDTEGAEQVLVVSRAPIVLGNLPTGDAASFEKVAFMGQVPVLVRGVVHSGDYIVASGRNDGSAVAVRAEDLTTDHLRRLVGRAWEDSKSSTVNFINTAIGINPQAARHVMEKQQKTIETNAREVASLKDENANLKARLERIEAMLNVVPEGK